MSYALNVAGPPQRFTFLPLLIVFLSVFLFSNGSWPAESPTLGRAMKAQDAEAGTLLVRASDHGQLRPMPTLATDVDINVTGMISRSTVTQHLANPTDQWLEGIYVFPLSESAAVDTLVMKIGERVIIGEIEERVKAKKIYEQAKKEGKKASLLEQERPNIFTTSVANIGPGEVVSITIEYQEDLRYSQGEFSLRFPMVVGPRYIPGARNITSSQVLAGLTTQTRCPMLPESHRKSLILQKVQSIQFLSTFTSMPVSRFTSIVRRMTFK